MKKIALCSLAVFLAVGNAWGEECTVSREWSVVSNNWNETSNEYLFPTEKDFLGASRVAYVYECDDSKCQDGTYVCLNSGHAFNKNNVNKRQCYKCVAPKLMGNDRWEEITDTTGLRECVSLEKRKYSMFMASFPSDDEYLYPTYTDFNNVNTAWTTKSEVYECDNNVCKHGTTRTLNPGHYFMGNKINSTRTYKCADGDYWLDITDDIKPADCPTCQKTLPSEVTPAPMPAPMPAPAPKKTCKELYPNGSKERLACCYAGAATKWTGDERNGTCTCFDTTLVWNGAKCIQKSQETDCYYTFLGSVMCANGGIINANTRIKLTKDDLNGNTCASFESLLARDSSKVTELANKYCNALDVNPTPTPDPNPVPAQPTINSAEINGARDRLARFFGDVDGDRSVWKNADGSFNATRLASDLTAGVVLGTVGGVVSGVLIKKSQIEKGFDALNCTVGGQKIADWGDEFRVGFRR